MKLNSEYEDKLNVLSQQYSLNKTDVVKMLIDDNLSEEDFDVSIRKIRISSEIEHALFKLAKDSNKSSADYLSEIIYKLHSGELKLAKWNE